MLKIDIIVDTRDVGYWYKQKNLNVAYVNFLSCESIAGTCFCAGKGEGFQKQKVLYCFGEVFTYLVLAAQHQPAL